MPLAMMALRSRVRKRYYVRFRSADLFPLTSLGAKPMSEVEHIYPELRARVMPLELPSTATPLEVGWQHPQC